MSVERQGYETQSREITVRSGQQQSYSFSLEKAAVVEKKSRSQIALEDEAAGRYDEALNYYNDILENNPRDYSALMGKARCLNGQDLEDDALNCLKRAANVALENGDNNARFDALSEIIKLSPNNFSFYDTRGDLLYSMGDYSRAAADFEKVVTLDRFNLKAHYKLGDSYYNYSNYVSALEAYKAVEELHFADPKAQVCLAKTYCALNDKKNAKKAYEKFKELASYSASLEFKKDPEWQKVLDYLGFEN